MLYGTTPSESVKPIIHVPASAVEKVYEEHKEELKTQMVAIAEDPESDCVIYLTEESDFPVLYVYEGGEMVHSKFILKDVGFEAATANIYEAFLLHASEPDDPLEFLDCEPPEYSLLADDLAYERDDELYLAGAEYLTTLLNVESIDDVCNNYGEEMIAEFTDFVCEALFTEFGISIYRPKVVIDETSCEEVWVDYPYEYNSTIYDPEVLENIEEQQPPT